MSWLRNNLESDPQPPAAEARVVAPAQEQAADAEVPAGGREKVGEDRDR